MKPTCPNYYHHSYVGDYYNYGLNKILDGEDNRCEICFISCYPCSCLFDIMCIIPMCLGCYKVSEAEINTDYSRCCKYMPRFPYTFTAPACDNCCIGCDKPGLGSILHDPHTNSCSDWALCCFPCTITRDILCSIPLIFGCLTLEKPT